MKSVTTIIIFLLFFAAVCAKCFAADEGGVLRIGFIGPLSGPYAIYGKAALNGAQMALDDSEVKNKLELLVEDDQGQPRNTVLAFRKMVDVEKVDAVISIASTLSNAVAPLAEQARIPLFAWASDPKVTAGRSFAIRTYPSGQDEGRAAAHEARRRGFKRIGVFSVISDYANSVREGFVAALPTSDVGADEEVPPDLADFRTMLAQLKHKQIDAAFLCLNPGQNANLAKQSRDLGLALEFFGCENLNSKDEAINAAHALDDAWFITVDVSPEFRREYSVRFGNEDVLSGAAIHRDLLKLLAGVYASGDSSAQLVQKVLASSEQGGAIAHYRYAKTETDQYLQARLVPQNMTSLLK